MGERGEVMEGLGWNELCGERNMSLGRKGEGEETVIMTATRGVVH